jgi:HD-GYP domain-containing protein (c-di-GMP phosphodiesterase class II)
MFLKKLSSFGFKSKKSTLDHTELMMPSRRVYTPVSQLVLGMYIIELDRPWLETAFMFQGFELKTKAELDGIKRTCDYVYIDTTRKRNTKLAINKISVTSFPNVLAHGVPPQKKGSFKKEILRAEKTYSHTEDLMSEFMIKTAQGGSIDGWLAKKAVAECVNSVLQSPDAMLWLTQLKNKHEYAMHHSLNVCVLAIVIGRHLNLPEKDLQNLGLCGLMHDVGKTLIPLHILDKKGALDEEELKIMRSHSVLGYELLRASDHIHGSAIETALTHHERIDGAGYPRRIHQGGISDFSKIIAIADTYNSITNNKPYEASRTHLDAIGILANVSGEQLDPTLVVKFVEGLGIYPPGCLVELTNKAVGIVIEVNEGMKLRPKIVLVRDEEKNPMTEQIIDLSKTHFDKKGGAYAIKNVVRAEEWNVDLEQFYQQIVLQKYLDIQ